MTTTKRHKRTHHRSQQAPLVRRKDNDDEHSVDARALEWTPPSLLHTTPSSTGQSPTLLRAVTPSPGPSLDTPSSSLVTRLVRHTRRKRKWKNPKNPKRRKKVPPSSQRSNKNVKNQPPIVFECSGCLRDEWIYHVGSGVDDQSEGLRHTNDDDEKSPSSLSAPLPPSWTEDDFVWDEELDKLGQGAFGTVYRATEVSNGTNNNRRVALKRLDKQALLGRDPNNVYVVQREVQLHVRLRHDHICPLWGYFSTPTSLYMVLEEAPGGDLYHYIQHHYGGSLSVKDARHVLVQVVDALAYLQAYSVAHRDVKLENLLVYPNDVNERIRIKLTDFGAAVRTTTRRRTLCGTPEYLAPEVIDCARSSKKGSYEAMAVDLWAAGVVAYELVVGQTPFYLQKSEKERRAHECQYQHDYYVTFDLVCQFEGLDPYELPAWVGRNDDDPAVLHQWWDFCHLLLQVQPERRGTCRSAQQHSWLSSSSSSWGTTRDAPPDASSSSSQGGGVRCGSRRKRVDGDPK